MARTRSCCCGCSVRAGTLLLLFLDLTIYGWIFAQLMNSSFGSSPNGYSSGNVSTGSILLTAALLVTVKLGLFGIRQKKPMLLIPYLFHRIIWAGVITIALELFTMNGGNVLKALPSSDVLPGMSVVSGLAELLKNSSRLVRLIIAFPIITIEIHFVRVVYSCYKEMEASKTTQKGITGMSVLGQLPVPLQQNSPLSDDNSESHV